MTATNWKNRADDSNKLKEQRREYIFQYKYSDLHQMAKNIRHDRWYIHVWRTHTSANVQPYTPKHHIFTTHIHNLQNRPSPHWNPFPLFSIYNARTNTTTHTHIPPPSYNTPFTTLLILPTPPPSTHTIVSCHSMSVFLSQQLFILFRCQSIVTAPIPDKFSNSSENKDAQVPALSGATKPW